MKYIRRNIKSLMKRETFIFTIINVFMIIAGAMICFDYGTYYQYKVERDSANTDLTVLNLELHKNEGEQKYVTKKMMEACLLLLPESVLNQIYNITLDVNLEDSITGECHFTFQGGKYGICEIVRDNSLKYGIMDGYFTQEQERNGERVVFISNNQDNKNFPLYDESENYAKAYVTIQGYRYRVIGTHSWSQDICILPFASLDDDTIITGNYITLSFQQALTSRQYGQIDAAVKETMGDLVKLPEIDPELFDETSLYNSLVLITALVTLLILTNFIILYRYILLGREREYAVLRLCGMRKAGAVRMYLAECLLLIVPPVLAGMGAYRLLVHPWLKEIYPYVGEAFGLPTYLYLFAAFFLGSLLLLTGNIIDVIYFKDRRKTA